MARTAAEIAEQMRKWLGEVDFDGFADLFADDALFEYPFGFPGSPNEIRGRDAIRDHLVESRRGLRALIEISKIEQTVHETADPDVVITEITVTGTTVATGQEFSVATGVGVITARDGKVVRYRDYSNVAGAARITGRDRAASA
jgi:hypothetical protein